MTSTPPALSPDEPSSPARPMHDRPARDRTATSTLTLALLVPPAVLVMLLAVGGCSDGPAGAPARPAPGQPAPSGAPAPARTADFSFVPPPGFVPVSTRGNPAVAAAYAQPGGGALSPTISIVATNTGGDLESEVAAGRRLQPTIFQGYRSTVDEPTTLPGGRRGWLSGGTYTLNGAAVQNVQLIVVERGFAYTITGVSAADRFAQVEPAFRASFTSFSVD